VASLLLLGLGACEGRPGRAKKPSKACLAAEAALARAITLGDYPGARSLRGAAYGQCGDRAELRRDDRHIAAGEAKLRAMAADRARAQRALAATVRAFLDFVAAERDTPERASIAPRCDEDTNTNADAATHPHFCVAIRKLSDGHVFEVRYVRAEPTAVRFTTTVDGPLDCGAVGGTESRRWQVATPTGGEFARARCELAGSLHGLFAVVSASSPSSLHVVSASYVERDPGSRDALAP
jgi:hypothetical protein